MALADFAQPTWSITPEQGQQLNTVAFDETGSLVVTSTSQEYGKTNVGVYCYQTDGKSVSLKWTQDIGSNVDYGTFWVSMAATGNYCAAAGHTSTTDGYLYIYDVANGGNVVGNFSFSSRVNEVELTPSGTLFIAVQGCNAILGQYDNGNFTQTTVSPNPNAYMRTCSVSTNETWAVAGGAIYSNDKATDSNDKTSSPTGIICAYKNVNGAFQYQSQLAMPNQILRIAMIDDGEYFVATDNQGIVYLFSLNSPTPLWSYTPPYSCDLTYAAAIAYNSSGDVMVGVGTNISVTRSVQSESASAFEVQPGLVYVLKNTVDSGSATGFSPAVQWQQRIEYPPNPGLNFSADAKYLTCATGQPYDSSNETTGSFYLFDGATGFQYWRFDTSIMNWPMQINPSATACIGGSDNGTLYYWGQPTTS